MVLSFSLSQNSKASSKSYRKLRHPISSAQVRCKNGHFYESFCTKNHWNASAIQNLCSSSYWLLVQSCSECISIKQSRQHFRFLFFVFQMLVNSILVNQWIRYHTLTYNNKVSGVPFAITYDDNRSDNLPYARDDEPFLQLIKSTYRDDQLHEWLPRSPVQGNSSEPGYMGNVFHLDHTR